MSWQKMGMFPDELVTYHHREAADTSLPRMSQTANGISAVYKITYFAIQLGKAM